MKTRNISTPKYDQHGFSLIELMVAMVVSLILMLSIASLLLANKESSSAEDQLATLQQNTRLARFVLENAVAHAGYVTDLTTSPQHAFPKGFVSDALDADRVQRNDANRYDNDSDSITIRFTTDHEINNCLGATPDNGSNGTGSTSGSGTPITAHYELYVDAEHELQCTIYEQPDSKDDIKHTEPLVSNVVLMQVRYGLDSTPNDTNYGIDQYTTTLDADNRDQVRSVRIQLVLSSKDKVRTQPLPHASKHGFNIAGYTQAFIPGQVFTPDAASGATANALPNAAYHAYVMVDQVIALRNLLP